MPNQFYLYLYIVIFSEYMYDKTDSCSRPIQNLAVQCATLGALQSETYFKNFRIISVSLII